MFMNADTIQCIARIDGVVHELGDTHDSSVNVVSLISLLFGDSLARTHAVQSVEGLMPTRVSTDAFVHSAKMW